MVDTLEIPLSSLNAIPGVSDLDDVAVDVPQLSDIEGLIDDVITELQNLEEDISELLDLVGDLEVPDVDEIETQLSVPSEDELTDAILNSLDVDEGLFGPLDSPLDQVVDNAVQDALEGLDGLDVSGEALDIPDLTGVPELIDDVDSQIGDVVETVETIDETLGELDDLSVDDLEQTLDNALDGLGPSIDDVAFFNEPVAFTGLAIERGLEQAVDDETQQELQDRVE